MDFETCLDQLLACLVGLVCEGRVEDGLFQLRMQLKLSATHGKRKASCASACHASPGSRAADTLYLLVSMPSGCPRMREVQGHSQSVLIVPSCRHRVNDFTACIPGSPA